MGLLMRQEPEEILVRRMAQRPLGGSGNNPFLKPNRTAKEYTVLIEPQAIAKKIMQVYIVGYADLEGGVGILQLEQGPHQILYPPHGGFSCCCIHVNCTERAKVS